MKSFQRCFFAAAALLSFAAHAQRPPNPCSHAIAAHIQCVPGITDNAHWLSALSVSGASKTMPWQGNTAATVAAQFPVVINWEFQTESAAVLNAQMAQFSDLNLARFSHEYWVESNGQLSTLMYYAAVKLTAGNLVRLRRAFGSVVDANIIYAPPATQSAYQAAAKGVPIKQSHAAYVAAGHLSRTINALPGGVAAPTTEMTPYEIFNEYLWTSATTEMGAFAMMLKYASANLGAAAMFGWHVGGHFYHFAESVDPSYGYDLTTMYGDYNLDFGSIDGGRSGHGEVGDIVVVEEWCDNEQPC